MGEKAMYEKIKDTMLAEERRGDRDAWSHGFTYGLAVALDVLSADASGCSCGLLNLVGDEWRDWQTGRVHTPDRCDPETPDPASDRTADTR